MHRIIGYLKNRNKRREDAISSEDISKLDTISREVAEGPSSLLDKGEVGRGQQLDEVGGSRQQALSLLVGTRGQVSDAPRCHINVRLSCCRDGKNKEKIK